MGGLKTLFPAFMGRGVVKIPRTAAPASAAAAKKKVRDGVRRHCARCGRIYCNLLYCVVLCGVLCAVLYALLHVVLCDVLSRRQHVLSSSSHPRYSISLHLTSLHSISLPFHSISLFSLLSQKTYFLLKGEASTEDQAGAGGRGAPCVGGGLPSASFGR